MSGLAPTPVSFPSARMFLCCDHDTQTHRELVYRPLQSTNAVSNAIDYAMHSSRSHDAVIRVYDDTGNVIETHEHKGRFQEW